jgi:membrane protein DedA with SNARE-associated domain/membrane-associated phospholipid phosphatase
MEAWFYGFLDWVAANPGWANFFVFLLALGESLVIVGLFVPGTLLLFGAGALVAAGALELGPTLFWAFVGAVLGDGVSYWLGRHYQMRLRVIWPFRHYPRLVSRGVDYFHQHGGKSIFFGRFVGPVRPIVPAVAGMLGMRPLRFTAVNVFSALLWAPAYILPGVVFGASLGLAAEVATRLAVLLVLLVAILWFTAWLVHRTYLFVHPRAGAMVLALTEWSRRHPHLGGISTALLDPRQPESRALFILAAVLVAFAWLFFTLIWTTVGDAAPAPFDMTVYHLMEGLRTPWADRLMVLLKKLGDIHVYLPVALAALAWLAWRDNLGAAAHLAAAVGFGALLTLTLQVSHTIPRPIDLYENTAADSFPSGHLAMALMVYGFLAVLVGREITGLRAWLPYMVAGVLIAAVGLGRLYLGLHWISDMAAGVIVGLAWLVLLAVAYRRHPAPPVASGRLVGVALAALAIAGTLHLSRHYEAHLERYALRQPEMRVLDPQAWWETDWRLLPAYRIDLRGRREHPLNLQWAGPLEALADHLQAHGWRAPVALSPTNTLRWLNPEPHIQELPVLPNVHDGHHESLLLTRPTDDPHRQLVLRLWPADVRLGGDSEPLYIGSVTEQRLVRHIPLLTFARTGHDFSGPLAEFKAEFDDELSWRVERRALAPRQADREIYWEGELLMAAGVPH